MQNLTKILKLPEQEGQQIKTTPGIKSADQDLDADSIARI